MTARTRSHRERLRILSQLDLPEITQKVDVIILDLPIVHPPVPSGPRILGSPFTKVLEIRTKRPLKWENSRK